jgi:hypothetical protein
MQKFEKFVSRLGASAVSNLTSWLAGFQDGNKHALRHGQGLITTAIGYGVG